ncbi:hypothetical protein [Fodinibius sp. SL11]|uniref:hypothetical protein n=1 Tax=Fodinibius sp. SL11 TaxID=3425690 RepID=UPI003F881714
MDLGTGLAVFGSAKLVEKLLGPTVEYMGEGLKDLAEKRVNNVKRIFNVAHKQLGERIDEDGRVPPRVLKGVLEEGSFVEDELSAQYFGGVLAASRSKFKNDDRGTSFISLITKLSSYQLHLHFILYNLLRKEFLDKRLNIASQEHRRKLRLYIDLFSLENSFNISSSQQFETILQHSAFGLNRETLIEDFAFGKPKDLLSYYSEPEKTDIKNRSFVFTPSAFGVELFLWAHGEANTALDWFLSRTVELECYKDIELPKKFGKYN